MKKFLTSSFFLVTFFISSANNKDSVINYALPDSVKAISFMAEIKVQSYNKKKFFSAGIKTDTVSLSIQNYYGKGQIKFYSLGVLNNNIRGLNVWIDRKMGGLVFSYDWETNITYKLLISQATDSAGNFTLFSGYIFLPKENKWKLIGTVKIEKRWNNIQRPAFFYQNGKKQDVLVTTGQVWCQRQNGSWKSMLQKDLAPPVVNLYSHLDSLEQLQIDKKLITQTIAENKTDAKQEHDGIYYTILKEGSGRLVSVNDTVTVYYKGYLFSDNSVFDETKDKPATFPLKRLIMGWQIGVPFCKVGGKIKIIIPSNLAYSIRTRAAKIPPNSILVFEVEVVGAKTPQ
jgi:hypothetical protein